MHIAHVPGSSAHRFGVLPRFWALALAVLAAGLVSCGGGGSDTPTASAIRESTTSIPVGRGALLVRTVDTYAATDPRKPQAVPPTPLPPGTIFRNYVYGVQTHVVAYVFINPFTCAYIENGTITKTVDPTHGELAFSHESVTYGGNCPGPYPSAVAKYTWTDGTASPGIQDFFSLHFVTTSGSASANTNWLATLVPATAAHISRDGIDITDPRPNAQEVFVGEGIHLEGTVSDLPPGVTVASQEWKIDPTYVGGFYEYVDVNNNNSEGRLIEAVVNTEKMTFYWIAPSARVGVNRNVTYTATLSDGSPISATAKFIVTGPDLQQVLYSTGKINVSKTPKIKYSFGDLQTHTKAGLYITHPALPPASRAGASLWKQLVLTDHFVFRIGPNTAECTVPPESLDNRLIAWIGYMWDSPWMEFTRGPPDTFDREFSARAYAMWDPVLPDSIAVPLAFVEWGFKMKVLHDPVTGRYSGGSSAFVPAYKPSLQYPTWSKYVNNDTLMKHYCIDY